jgi:hypothetical protein
MSSHSGVALSIARRVDTCFRARAVAAEARKELAARKRMSFLLFVIPPSAMAATAPAKRGARE